MRSIYGLSFDALEGELTAAGLRPAHARTLWRALHRDGVGDLAAREDFLPPLRRWAGERLGTSDGLCAALPPVQSETASSDGLTRKFLLALADGQTIETVLMPEYTRGQVRARNPAYRRTESAIRRARRGGDRAAVRELRQRQRGLPNGDPRDPGYRRLRYTRYADDALFGFTGPKAEAEEIRTRLAQFLHDDLKLELSREKTLITHARTQAAKFLGYEVTVAHDDRSITGGIRRLNGTVQLRVPGTVIKAKCAPYLQRGKPASRPALKDRDDHAIISTYGAEYRGIVQYYLLAGNVWRLDRLEWVMKTSMLKTLAHRHRSTVTKMARKYKAVTATPGGPRRCFEAHVERHGRKPLVARFGGIPLRRQRKAVIDDRPQGPARPRQRELITRLLAGRCEWCEQPAPVEAHQVRKLADLTRTGQPQPGWARLMARKRRKTLIICRPCHDYIHASPVANAAQSLESPVH